jgi:hypothetical protein
MKFKEWFLIQEKAERTSSRVPLYPPQYHTKQYTPLYHAPYTADYPVWLKSKLQPFTYTDFENAFGHEKPPKPEWTVYDHDTPAHAHTVSDKFKWTLPD